MARLPDGSHRCPRCKGTFAEADMTARTRYCRPCWAAIRRASYARTRGGLKRPHEYGIPADFVERAGKVSDVTLAGLYGVSYVTIRRWRHKLGIAPKRRTREELQSWGRQGMAKLRATMPERCSGQERARRAVAVREARRASLDAALDSSGRIIPTSNDSVLAEAGISRDLMRMAMQAMAQAGSRATEEDYA